jgi:hypothetical protein
MQQDCLVSLTAGVPGFQHICAILTQLHLSHGQGAEKLVARCVLHIAEMTRTIVVMPGRAIFNLKVLHSVARDFGWGVKLAENLSTLGSARRGEKPAAVLFHRSAFESHSWLDALRPVKSALPGIRPIACHEFSDAPDWPELCGAGAFHALWLPLKEGEVRQSFGFVAEAENRESRAPGRLPITLPIIVPAWHSNAGRGISRHMADSARQVMISAAG